LKQDAFDSWYRCIFFALIEEILHAVEFSFEFNDRQQEEDRVRFGSHLIVIVELVHFSYRLQNLIARKGIIRCSYYRLSRSQWRQRRLDYARCSEAVCATRKICNHHGSSYVATAYPSYLLHLTADTRRDDNQ
jgi:hypothetical protein